MGAPAIGFSSMETAKSDTVITVALVSSASVRVIVTVISSVTLPEVIRMFAVKLCTVSKSKRAASATVTTPVDAFIANAPVTL